MTNQGIGGTVRLAQDELARTNNQIQQHLNDHLTSTFTTPTFTTLMCWQGAVANAHSALGDVLGAFREANDGHINARRTLGELKRIVRKPNAGDGELKDIVAHLQTYQDSIADNDGTATDQLSKIAAVLGVSGDKDLSLEVEQLCEDFRKADEDYNAASRVLREVREALDAPNGSDIVAYAKMTANTKNKLARESSRFRGDALFLRNELRNRLRGCPNNTAVPTTDVALVKKVSELVSHEASFRTAITDMLGLPSNADSSTILNEVGRRDREVSRAEGVRTELKVALGLPSDASDAALIGAAKRVKRQLAAEQANREENEPSTSRYAKFKADVAHKLGLSKHMAVERAIFNAIDNLQYQLRQSEDFGTRIRNALDLPASMPDVQVASAAAWVRHIKDKNTESLDKKNAEVARQAAEIEKLRASGAPANVGRINGRPVTQALSDLVQVRKRQPYSLKEDREVPAKLWGNILKEEAGHFNFLAHRDGDNQCTGRLRNAVLRIAGICLAIAERMDGVKDEDIQQ